MTEPMFFEFLVFAGLMGALATVRAVAVTFIKRKQGGQAPSAAVLDQIAQQLAALQQTVESTAIEVERISEAQRFTTKLLAERGAAGAPSASGVSDRPRRPPHDITPH
jgi:hypothetical protein